MMAYALARNMSERSFRLWPLGGTYPQSRWLMNVNTNCASLLKTLEGRILTGVMFIHDYIQFYFDESIFNAYTLPHVIKYNATLKPATSGYCDALCELIGKTVIVAHEVDNHLISLEFCDKTVVSISLRSEDQDCAESAMFQDGSGKRWNFW